MMVVDEDILKFLILEMFQQLAVLREAGASHGDVKPENIMIHYTKNTAYSVNEHESPYLSELELIDFGCSGPDGDSQELLKSGLSKYPP